MVARACDLDRGSWAGENIGQSSKDGARLPLELEVSGQLIKGRNTEQSAPSSWVRGISRVEL